MPRGKASHQRGGKGKGKIIDETKKSVSFSATTNKLLFDVDAEQTEGSVKTDSIGEITIKNTGKSTAYAILGYKLWTSSTGMTALTYQVNYLLRPDEELIVPDCPAVISDETVEQLVGSSQDNVAPNSNMYVATTLDTDDGTGADITGSATETKVFVKQYSTSSDCGANYFKLGDLIRVNNEIMEVTAIGDKTDADNNFLTVIRGLYGSTAASDHADDAAIRLPFFNAYHDFDTYTVAQTDAGGRFKCFNMLGYGRATTLKDGIVPGSFSIKFYEAGYQNITDVGDISPSTNSGLSASTTYYFSISIDGGTTDPITFTTGSNVLFGGSDGVISKMQAAIDAIYYDPDENGYQKKATVAIVDGDIRITSGQHLSTSAIAITTNTAGTVEVDELFDGQTDGTGDIGRFKAVIPSAVAAKLPSDVIYDRITNLTSPNESVFGTDDGYGNIEGKCVGTINYETGAFDIQNAPPNAEFVVSVQYNSTFSGAKSATATTQNTLKTIYGNLPDQKLAGELTITRR